MSQIWNPVGLSEQFTPTTPTRALNTTFMPSATRPVLCMYSVQVNGTTTLLSGDDGVIELRSDTGSPPTTVRASMRNRVFQGLGVTVGTNTVVRAELVYLCPPGHNINLTTVVLLAAPIFTLVNQTEIVL